MRKLQDVKEFCEKMKQIGYIISVYNIGAFSLKEGKEMYEMLN